MHLEGAVALITGGARGVGYAIAQDFVERGARVVIVDSGGQIDGTRPDSSVVDNAVKELRKNAVGCALDIGSPQFARDAVQTAIDQWGRLDIVINNAAILRDHFIFKAKPEDFDEVMRVNLAGAYYVLAAATPVLREQAKNADANSPYTRGRIVNIVSTAGIYGNYGQASYASAKNGLIGLTRVAAFDLARSGITANAVAPFARSRVTDIIVPANDEQATYKERALKIDPSYVATVVSWLCSSAGHGVTGQLFGVRGREVFLFSQPRPVRTVTLAKGDWNLSAIADASAKNFESQFTKLVTDLESFNSEPYI